MDRKTCSLSQKLFRTYAGWFLLCLFIILCLAIWYVATVISQNIADTREQLSQNIDENIENYFKNMNSFSIELLNSGEFKKAAVSRLPKISDTGMGGASEAFSTMYLESYKMIQEKYRIGILVDNQYYIWMGHSYYISPVDTAQIHTYDDLVRDETPVVKYLSKNEYLEQTGGDRFAKEKEQSYITLSRSMDPGNRYLNGRAVLEIMTDVDEFKNMISGLSGNTDGQGLQVNIYDTYGQPIYTESDLNLTSYVEKGVTGVLREKGSMIDVHKIFNGRLTVVYTIDSATYYNKLFSFLIMALFLSILIFGAITVITYKISEQISKPIHNMCGRVRSIDLKQGIHFEKVETHIDELEFLSDSLREMSVDLGESLQNIITLKDYETQARMLALQAQMQPHFLFNTLTMIGTLAEEDGNVKITRICLNLTKMFRYIADSGQGGVRMFEEIRHVEQYVEIMKERFPTSKVQIDIPLELMNCRIPKLIVQPLVENAFKYCKRQKPEITVRGYLMEDGRWTVEVKDNGDGFPIEKKEEIMKKCREGMKDEKALSSQIDGMGLVNVFVRLKLFFGENMTYHIEALEGKIVIGGCMNGDAGTI
ncbi:sensor histidine kinase [Diplocloster hominis]|uniref:sensor histidine kinase n=1 Tax=Diplocloster hominis TaxID=3079010 RepID=UPI0031BA7F27